MISPTYSKFKFWSPILVSLFMFNNLLLIHFINASEPNMTLDSEESKVMLGSDEKGSESKLKYLLREAIESNEYDVKILEKDGKNGLKKIVILGETHFKKDQASQLGKEIIQNFNFIGLEGFDPSKAEPNHISTLSKIAFPINALLYGGLTEFFNVKGSSTYDAQNLDLLSSQEKWMLDYILHNEWLQITRPYAKYLIDIMFPIKIRFNDNSEFREWCLSVGITKEMTEERDATGLFLKAKQALFKNPKKSIVMLEVFSPLTSEMLDWNKSIGKAFCAVKGCCALLGATLLTYLGRDYLPLETQYYMTGMTVCGVASTVAYIQSALDPFLPEAYQIKKNPFLDSSRPLNERDELMSLTAMEAIKANSSNNTLLIIVGRSHVAGLVKNFTTRYGFQETSF